VTVTVTVTAFKVCVYVYTDFFHTLYLLVIALAFLTNYSISVLWRAHAGVLGEREMGFVVHTPSLHFAKINTVGSCSLP
jgi:hypothetical protein